MGLANDRTGLVMWKIIPRAWKDVVNCLKKKSKQTQADEKTDSNNLQDKRKETVT